MEQKLLTVKDIVSIIEGFAPPELAQPWDNAGLQAGNPDSPVRAVLISLDVTKEVVQEAAALGCDMILAHHPIFFHGVKALPESEPDGALMAALIRGGVALYTSHTALDIAPGGIGDALAEALGLKDVQEDGFLRLGIWDGGCLGKLYDHVRASLGIPSAILYGHPSSPALRVALCGGSGMPYLIGARGVDVVLTGDVTHHDALDTLAKGIAIIDIGHRGGELIAVELLECGLQKHLSGVEYPLQVHRSAVNPYAIVTGMTMSRFG